MTRGEIDPVEIRWLPDGSAVDVLVSDGSLLLLDPTTLERTPIASGLLGPSGSASAPRDWAPDSSAVALGVTSTSLEPEIDIIYPITDTRTTLATFKRTGGSAQPVYSADGDSLFIFLHYYDPTPSSDVTQLYELSLSGGAPVKLADLSLPGGSDVRVTWPVVHPNGTYIFYVQDRQLWRINTDGTGRVKVAGDQSTRIRGPVAFTQTVSGDRIAWIASTFHGLAVPTGLPSDPVAE